FTSKVIPCLPFFTRAEIPLQEPREHLLARLHGALGPATLLGLERVHLDRKLCRHGEIMHEDELPPLHLGPVAEIEVLGQGVVLPSSRVFDSTPAQDSGGAVEIEEAAAEETSEALQDEMAVEKDRLRPGQKGVVAV